MKKLCLTLSATIMLTLGAMAQSTPIQEQEKMSEPAQNTEINGPRGDDGVGKALDNTESTPPTDKAQPKANEKEGETATQKEKTNKPGKRSQADEDETGKKKKKTKKENPE